LELCLELGIGVVMNIFGTRCLALWLLHVSNIHCYTAITLTITIIIFYSSVVSQIYHLLYVDVQLRSTKWHN